MPSGIYLRISGTLWEPSGSSLEALWGALLGSLGLPGGSLGLPGHGRHLGGKMMENHYVFLSKVARPDILHERGEGDPHRLPRLRTKVGGRRPRADPAQVSPTS